MDFTTLTVTLFRLILFAHECLFIYLSSLDKARCYPEMFFM